MPVLPAPTEATHVLGGATFTSLATPSRGSTDVSVWRVQIAPGPDAVPHRLTRQEVFVILSGQAEVRLGGEVSQVEAGGVVIVPVDTDFALAAAGDEAMEALCVLPAGGQAVLPGGEPFTPPWAQ